MFCKNKKLLYKGVAHQTSDALGKLETKSPMGQERRRPRTMVRKANNRGRKGGYHGMQKGSGVV